MRKLQGQAAAAKSRSEVADLDSSCKPITRSSGRPRARLETTVGMACMWHVRLACGISKMALRQCMLRASVTQHRMYGEPWRVGVAGV